MRRRHTHLLCVDDLERDGARRRVEAAAAAIRTTRRGVVALLHVHKTGGSTLCVWAAQHELVLVDGLCHDAWVSGRVDEPAAAVLGRWRAAADMPRTRAGPVLLANELGLGREFLLPSPSELPVVHVIVVRDPLDRLLSSYRMSGGGKLGYANDTNKDATFAAFATLTQYLEEGCHYEAAPNT